MLQLLGSSKADVTPNTIFIRLFKHSHIAGAKDGLRALLHQIDEQDMYIVSALKRQLLILI